VSDKLAAGLLAMLVGGGLALVGLTWLTDPSYDAGCDDPRMNCSNTTTQESP
jgi:hypothetical protein